MLLEKEKGLGHPRGNCWSMWKLKTGPARPSPVSVPCAGVCFISFFPPQASHVSWASLLLFVYKQDGAGI